MKLAPLVIAISLVAGPFTLIAAAGTAPKDDIGLKPAIPEQSPIEAALRMANRRIDDIVSIPNERRTFRNTIAAMDDVLAELELGSNMTMFMAYVSTDAEERDRGQQAEEHYTNWLIDLGKREDLYEVIKAIADTNPELRGEERRLLDHTMRDYRRAGMTLSSKTRETLKEVQKELTRLSIEFEKNIREDETRVPLTREELSGMSEDYFAGLTRTGDMYLLGMSYPEFIPIQDYCDNEATREKTWLAYKRRGGRQNVRVLERILELRAEHARLLGYAHPADYETEVRMAKNADTVLKFYDELRPLVRRKARLDYQEFVEAKRRHTGDYAAELEPWDFSFYEKLLKKEKYAVDSELVREHLPLDACIDGLFGITQSLYGLKYTDITERARAEGRKFWHEDVKLYEVTDAATGGHLGDFYLDLHPRENKYGHAAQWGLAQHKVWINGEVTKPLAALVCNFSKPTADKPSLLTHEELETFFHEFGHCLHTILSEGRFWQFSGTSVERDFVEAPSQMFENWVWDGDVLRSFARHHRTGAPFSSDLLDGMVAARYLGSGMLAERQFFYGLFDMTCHVRPDGKVDTTALAHDLWGGRGEGVELYAAVPETFFHAAFGHLTGYQAGYYGYQWSLVYACDMFQRFKELGMLDPDAGMYYRKNILAKGGSEDGLDLVRGYLGREPDMKAFLRHLGLNE